MILIGLACVAILVTTCNKTGGQAQWHEWKE